MNIESNKYTVTRREFRSAFLQGHWSFEKVGVIYGRSKKTIRGWFGKDGYSDMNHILPITQSDLLKIIKTT